MFRGRRCNFIRNYRVHWKKAAESKCPKPEKNLRSLVVKNSTEEKINSDRMAPKMTAKSSSRLKSVPEKLKNYFFEQDEVYFSSQETGDVLLSGKSRKN